MNNIDKTWVMKWLYKSLGVNFKGRSIIKKQIENSELTIEQHCSYISVRFRVKKGVEKYLSNIRVPVEMRVFRKTLSPIIFLLHIVDGLINEFEIITADSSQLDISNFEYQKIEYEVNRELIV